MDLNIACQCFIEKDSLIVVDSAGSIIPAKAIIVCKEMAFIITEDGYIDRFSGEGMGVIYQAAGKDFNFLEAQVRELFPERKQMY